ncbi:MAG: hypothetical protein LBD73_07735 [Deferribacteraceae bacterium]|jgi:biofilm PGA synthesis lipoprotein PgaB|nr:hypothetical protein [Deferribacteraceae bacterium]
MKVLLTALITAFSLAWAYPFEIYEKSRPAVEGAQVFVIDPFYEGRLDDFFREIKRAGSDTVFLRVFHNKGDRVHLGGENPCPEGGVYFASETACVTADILDSASKSAEKHGVKLFAWMATRSLSFLKTEDNLSLSFTPDGGKSGGYGANIFNPAVRSALLALFTELAEYEIDGILLQDDFIMKYAEGADPFACKEFSEKTGMACTAEEFFYPSATSAFGKRKTAYDRWNRWKADELAKLFLEIRRACRLINPKLLWAVNIYYETPVYADKGLLWYSHDMTKLVASGADYLAIMAYHEQISREMRLGERATLDYLKNMALSSIGKAGSGQIIFKVQVRRFDSERSPIEADEINSVRSALRSGGGTNFIRLPVNSPRDISGGQ